MKNKAEIIFGLLAIGIVVFAFKDKIFKKKEVTNNLSDGNTVLPKKTTLSEEILAKYGSNYSPKINDFVYVGDDRYTYVAKIIGSKNGGLVYASPNWVLDLYYTPNSAIPTKGSVKPKYTPEQIKKIDDNCPKGMLC
jgi:hypothetical protein